jgi:hypothetical protein
MVAAAADFRIEVASYLGRTDEIAEQHCPFRISSSASAHQQRQTTTRLLYHARASRGIANQAAESRRIQVMLVGLGFFRFIRRGRADIRIVPEVECGAAKPAKVAKPKPSR